MSRHNWQWCLMASLVFVGACIHSSAATTGELDYEYGESPDLYEESASAMANSLSGEKASRLKVRTRSSMKLQRGDHMRSRPVRRHARAKDEHLDPLQRKLQEYNSKLEKERALLQQHEKLLAAERAKFRQHQEQREKLIVAAMRNKHKGAVVPKSYGVNDILQKFKPHGGGHKGHLVPQDLAETSDEKDNEQRAEGEDEGDLANEREPVDEEQNEEVATATDRNTEQGDEVDANGDETTPEPPIAPKAASGRRRGKLRFKPVYDEFVDEEEDNSEPEPMRSPRRRKKKQQRRTRRKPKYVQKLKPGRHVIHLPSVESAQVEPWRNQHANRDNKVNEKRNQRKRQNNSDESDDNSQMDSEYRDKILRNNVLRSIF